MKYKAIRRSYGFLGRLWNVDDIVDVDDSVIPPHHFVPIGAVKKPVVDPGKPVELEPGQQLKVKGGFGHNLSSTPLPRILTTDVVPNNVSPAPLKKTRKPRQTKDVGDAKK